MYPELFSIGNFTISTFGLMLALAFLVGSWITAVRMEEEGLDPDLAWSLLVWVMLGGIAGSKLYFAIDTHLRTDRPFLDLLLARDGITWYRLYRREGEQDGWISQNNLPDYTIDS